MPLMLRQAVKCIAWDRAVLPSHLAQMLGLSRSCISKVFAGKRGLSLEKAELLKIWLNTPARNGSHP